MQAQDNEPFGKEDVIYHKDSVIVLPQFIGGDELLMRFIAGNVKYPKDAVKRKIQGQVVVRFVITKEGKVTDPHVLKSVHHLLDEEALRVISLMPDWIPGTLNEKPVSVYFNLPISFKLKRENKSQSIEKDQRAKYKRSYE